MIINKYTNNSVFEDFCIIGKNRKLGIMFIQKNQ